MKKFLSMVLALVMVMSLVTVSAGAKSFTDDSKITYKEAVDVVSEIGIVDGYEDGAFNPQNTLTRGAAAKIICNLILGPTTASALSADTAPYSDVPTSNTFAGYIAYCAQQGIISGYADGTFRPAATLTGYAFMKMLLGALGYDASIEGFVGANWSVQVGKTALGIGLEDGNDEFVGVNAVNREEACLYVFNTLQATMMEYDSKITANVNGAEVTIGNSKASPVRWATGTKNDGNIDQDGYVQFAEQYFDKLVLKDGTDDFARPANVWEFKSNSIGTYPKTADATYTKRVEVGDIYKDLGLAKTIVKGDVSVYVDGVSYRNHQDAASKKEAPVDIKKGDDDNKYGANGVLTQVFFDEDDGTIIITEIHTYVAEVNKNVAATAKKDAYVQIATLDVRPSKGGNLEFETEETFEEDSYVQYTYSESANAVKSVAVTEMVEGTATKVINNSKDLDENKGMTIDGTDYKVAKTISGDVLGSVSVKGDYTIYLDQYGYILYIEESELAIQNYALLLKTAASSTFVGKKAELVFTDGTSGVVTTDKNYNTGSNAIADNTIVSFKVDDAGVYSLKEVQTKQSSGEYNGTMSVTNEANFQLENDKASIAVSNSFPVNTGDAATTKSVTANSKTVFVVQDPLDNEEYTAYTGIKNAPSIKAGASANEQVSVYYYCKSGSMTTVMFILPESAVTIDDNSNTLLYIAKESCSDLIHDADGDYFEYKAIVNGEITTAKVADDVIVNSGIGTNKDGSSLNGLYASFSTNKHGIITKVTGYDPYNASTDAKVAVNNGTGIDKRSADYTVVLDTQTGGANATVTVDDNAGFFFVDKKGNISTGTYRSVVKDTNDKVFAVVKDYLVQNLIVETVEDTTGGGGGGGGALPWKSSVTDIRDNGRFTVTFTYERPEYVPNSSPVDLAFTMYEDGYATSVSGTVRIPANSDTATFTSSVGQLVDPDTVVTAGVTSATPVAVKVLYQDMDASTAAGEDVYLDAADLKVSSSEAATTTVTTGAAQTIKFMVNHRDTSSSVLTYNTKGLTVDVSSNAAMTAGTAVTISKLAAGTDYVVIEITGLSALEAKYAFENKVTSAFALSTKGISGDDADTTLTLTVTGGDSQTLAPNAQVAGTIELSDAPTATGVYGYRVVCAKLGLDEILTSTTAANWSIRVKSDVTIEAGDITVEVVEALKVVSYEWDAGQVKITFNRDVAPAAPTVNDSAANINITVKTASSSTAWSAKAVDNVITVTAVTGNFMTADKVALTNAIVDASDGNNKLTAMTITLDTPLS